MAESASAKIISLPMFPQLTADQQASVAKDIFGFTSRRACKRSKGNEGSLELAELIA
jgi:hypothetical protein